MEETGLCLFLPRRQYSASIAPSFVEAVAGKQDATPDPRHIALAEELLVRMEADSVAVRLNLLGQVGEQPDFVVAAWVLPYVYALRGDRDWRRNPQLTGSRQVSQLAVQAYKQLETGDQTIAELKQALGREVTEGAVLRAITELWQQLRIIPVIAAPGQPVKWQLLRTRYQKAIAEGASTSQVTAISVLASIYLQAVIAAGMEEVELFLSPLTARSKVREVLRGLVATRQVHTISLGHAPHFYVAGTLPEFSVAPTVYASVGMQAASFFLHGRDEDIEYEAPQPAASQSTDTTKAPSETRSAVRKPAASGKPAAARPHFSRPATLSRDRKPAQSSSASRPARRSSSESRPASARTGNGSGQEPANRWNQGAPKSISSGRNGAHAGNGSTNGARTNGNGGTNGSAHGTNGATAINGSRVAKSSAPTWGQRNGHANGPKPVDKPAAATHTRTDSRSDVRPEARSEVRSVSRTSRKPTLSAGAKSSAAKRFGFAPRPKQGTKKRG
jgi:hypothetical protein